jgi:chorismate mutase
VLIAGPCAAETRAQVLRAAASVAEVDGVRFFRAGLWKPRTRSGGFEGVGERGLPWLSEASARFGLTPCVEVGLPAHVEIVARFGIEAVWMGARTSGDPFAVQQLASALQGTALRVLVKNPLTPSLGLWLGALERIERAAAVAPVAVHRGFDLKGGTCFRSAPMWELPLELRHRRPDLGLICDPSHIAGRRELVYGVAQSALDLGMDGLMVEVHPNPPEALSDAGQQLDPLEFLELNAGLRAGATPAYDPLFEEELRLLRERLSALDADIVASLGRRWEIVRSIAAAKKERGALVFQMGRRSAAMAEWKEHCERLGVPAELGEAVFVAIHEASVGEQTMVMRPDPRGLEASSRI